MRIVFWNIRAGGGNRVDGISRQIAEWEPTVVALAEFRGTHPSQRLAYSLGEMGYMHQLSTTDPQQPAINGLLLAATQPLERLSFTHQGLVSARWLLASVTGSTPLTLGVMHVPNFVTGLKAPFYRGVLDLLDRWSWGAGVLIGDSNSGMPYIDEESRAFTKLESDWMQALAGKGWAICFRHLHGDKRAYSWYSPNGRNGFRIDQAFVNPLLLPHVRESRYDWGAPRERISGPRTLSDHAAIVLDL